MSSFASDLAKGRLFGHPIHVMLIHFPAGLLPAGFVFDVLGRATGESSLAPAAFYCYAAGVVMALLAAVFGAMDYFRLGTEHRAWKTASIHALLNLAWLSLFTYVASARLAHYPDFGTASILSLIISGIGVCVMAVSNHLGGELVLRYRVGAVEEE